MRAKLLGAGPVVIHHGGRRLLEAQTWQLSDVTTLSLVVCSHDPTEPAQEMEALFLRAAIEQTYASVAAQQRIVYGVGLVPLVRLYEHYPDPLKADGDLWRPVQPLELEALIPIDWNLFT